MDVFAGKLNIFIIPPVLFSIAGFSLAVLCLLKGRRHYEIAIFGVFCVWASILPLSIVAHQIFRGDLAPVMEIERSVRAVYAFTPWIGMLFIHAAVKYRNRAITAAGFILSALFSLFSFTDYSMYGFWEYGWGYMVKGGVMQRLFSAYCALMTGYGIFMFIRKNRTATGEAERFKLRILVFSAILIIQLTLGNLPAMHGIDFYPPGNFAFVPMILMAWGVFRRDSDSTPDRGMIQAG